MTATCAHCQTPMPDGSRFCPTCGADRSDPGSGPRTGAQTGSVDLMAQLRSAVGQRYEVKKLLGRGGMGAVYLAVDRRLDRDVALKVLPPELAHDQQFVGRFEHEARTAAKLDHPGIIPIYSVEAEADLHFFVMKFVNGRSLDGLLAAGQMPVDLAQKILWEAACALGHAHQRGVVHRDVKPANIMLDENGRVLLGDFGISKALRSASSFTATGQVIGTPHYMSPEQTKGDEVGGASDQYSLAVVGYRMLAGRLPFEDDSVHTVIYKHVFQAPPDILSFREDLPPFLARAIHRAMAKSPGDRFPTMEAFATAVWPENPVEAKPGSGAHVPLRRSFTSTEAPTEISQPQAAQIRPTPPRRKRRARWPLALAGLVLLAGGGAGYVTLAPGGQELLRRVTGGTGATGERGPTGGTGAMGATGATDTTGATGVIGGGAAPVAVAADTTPRAPVETKGPPPRAEPRVPPGRQPERQPERRVDPPRATPAVQVGYLTIDATPAGVVVVDGREMGDTPQVRLELSPGEHMIEVRREGFRVHRERIVITAGNETRKRVLLVQDGG